MLSVTRTMEARRAQEQRQVQELQVGRVGYGHVPCGASSSMQRPCKWPCSFVRVTEGPQCCLVPASHSSSLVINKFLIIDTFFASGSL